MFFGRNGKLPRTIAAAILGFLSLSCLSFTRRRCVAGRELHSRLGLPSPSQEPAQNPSPYSEQIAEATRLYRGGKTDEAEKNFADILRKAKETKDNVAEAEGHLGLGGIAYRHASYDRARSECEEARSFFNALHDSSGVARTQLCFGNISWQLGDNKAAKSHYEEALHGFEAANLAREKADALLGMAYATEGYPERIKLDAQALEIARQIGDRRRQGLALHGIGQWVFAQGDSETAELRYKEAEAFLDSPDDQMPLARVLLSQGRLERAHGALDRAVELYLRALQMSEETRDKQGSVQIMNALGVAYGDQKKHAEALAIFQRAFDLSKDMNAPPMTEMLRNNIAESYVNLGEYQRGADIIEEMNRRTPDPFPLTQSFRYEVLARAYQHLGEYDRALAAATQSVEAAKARKNAQFLSDPLMAKARAEEKLGQNELALNDVQEALAAIESLRAHLVPTDFMKRGFADKTQEAFAFSVDLVQGMHQPERALEVAEQARSRAFLDLLAARGINSATLKNPFATPSVKQEMPTPADNRVVVAQNSPSSTLTTRGELRRDQPSPGEKDPGNSLPSPVAATSPSIDQMVTIGKRLDSTIVSYWVSSDTTYVWALKPDGTIRAERIPISEEHLSQLIAATMAPGETRPDASQRASTQTGHHATADGQEKKNGVMPLRGGGSLILREGSKEIWRELYKLLLLPLQESLPAQGSHLTIVPQGPLFRLSFAALQDAQGHYLVEKYALNYAPSLGVLRLTGERKRQLGQREPSYLIVADPLASPELLKETGLPALPGARQEALSLQRLLPHGEATVLLGSQANKDAMREKVKGKTVLHLATHAIVHDDQPFDSFLVLSAEDKSPPASGRLTVQEIYGMDLQTDLVMLSACSTALGKLSGDGVAGLTRAFFYGGTPSVVATLWDVADEPTSLLVSNFYASLQKQHDKSQALRTAQMQLVRALRAGRVQVNTNLGPMTLPEDPVFWAGFVLQGEP